MFDSLILSKKKGHQNQNFETPMNCSEINVSKVKGTIFVSRYPCARYQWMISVTRDTTFTNEMWTHIGYNLMLIPPTWNNLYMYDVIIKSFIGPMSITKTEKNWILWILAAYRISFRSLMNWIFYWKRTSEIGKGVRDQWNFTKSTPSFDLTNTFTAHWLSLVFRFMIFFVHF